MVMIVFYGFIIYIDYFMFLEQLMQINNVDCSLMGFYFFVLVKSIAVVFLMTVFF
jgi:hypothetical protein